MKRANHRVTEGTEEYKEERENKGT